MSTPSPLVPQGSIQDAPKGRRNLPVLVFSVIGLHAAALVVGLMIGCKPETSRTEDPLARLSETNFASSFPTDASYPAGATNPIGSMEKPAMPTAAPGTLLGATNFTPLDPVSTGGYPAGSGFATGVVPADPGTSIPVPTPSTGGFGAPGSFIEPTTAAVEPVPSSMTEHKVKSGESFSTMAQKYGVSVRAITTANPNLDPRRLQIGQVVLIPAAAPGTRSATAGGSTSAPASTGSYVVKPGDNLTKIAQSHGTTVKALKSLNGLKTDRINVGQKLKVPVKTAPAPAPEPVPFAPTTPAPSAPATGFGVPPTTGSGL